MNYRTYENKVHAEKYRIELQTELALLINRHVDAPEPFFLYILFTATPRSFLEESDP